MLITAKVRPTERDFYKRFYAALNAFILSAGFYALSPYLISEVTLRFRSKSVP